MKVLCRRGNTLGGYVPDPILSLHGITVQFGGLTAAKNIHLTVERDLICAVIGPNGAGKTTVFNCVTGIYNPTSGKILINQNEIRAQFSRKTLISAFTTGAIAAVAVTAAVNVQTLWDACINQLYIWGQPFPWARVIPTAWQTIANLDTTRTWIPALLSMALGIAGYFTTWHRSRHTPFTSVRSGIARTFQNIRLFKEMTVLENILVGMHCYKPTNYWDVLLTLPGYRRAEAERIVGANELLAFVGLSEFAANLASSLPYGYQRKLEIARALATKPDLLLLDEPAAGMNPSEMDELAELIGKIRASGVTVLLIEHHMKLVMEVCDHVTVLEYGEKISEGTPLFVQRDPKVIAAYLGDTHVEH